MVFMYTTWTQLVAWEPKSYEAVYTARSGAMIVVF